MPLRRVESHEYIPNDLEAQERWAKVLRLGDPRSVDGGVDSLADEVSTDMGLDISDGSTHQEDDGEPGEYPPN